MEIKLDKKESKVKETEESSDETNCSVLAGWRSIRNRIHENHCNEYSTSMYLSVSLLTGPLNTCDLYIIS